VTPIRSMKRSTPFKHVSPIRGLNLSPKPLVTPASDNKKTSMTETRSLTPTRLVYSGNSRLIKLNNVVTPTRNEVRMLNRIKDFENLFI
jgi:hypothetical protein